MSNIFSCEGNSITTAKKQMLYIDGKDAEAMRGKRVLIIDDVISTGESLRAVEKLVKQAGGNIVGKMAILAEGDAKYRDDIKYLSYLPQFRRHAQRALIPLKKQAREGADSGFFQKTHGASENAQNPHDSLINNSFKVCFLFLNILKLRSIILWK